ncbi:hypothetical protein [Gordonia sp. ABSL49_1]|uniref:hypothetical protein n=1 Tax=unclassified Gordonia (in: high G+C Gram-positive bacteria) TaxID=2657482 RepID=UPI001F0D9322|nr:hypothetical protein [Gordonia sp. ABSL49_1]MCH5641916.1 hypothetical protein [Gordonia sp. ABSL49_1]
MGAGFLATQLDKLMLRGKMSPADTDINDLPERTGAEIAAELGGRMLLRYVEHPDEVGRTHPTFVCPTPYSMDEVYQWLALPKPLSVRRWVVVLDPTGIDYVKGPKECSLGGGIEYLLPNGYESGAIASPGWAVEVR